MKEVRVSVAMAVYNGETYVKEQIDSILSQFGKEDELVISYDASTDRTLEIIQGYAAQDDRIRVVLNDRPGVQNNFNNAVMSCRGQYIFLSDQDDVWVEGKLSRMLDMLQQKGVILAVHNAKIVNADLSDTGKTIDDIAGASVNPLSNFIRGTYWGCCMAFRRELIPAVCPFPNKHKVGHDIWIGMIASACGKIARTDECLLLHRVHGGNVTVSTRKLPAIAEHRFALMGYLIGRFFNRKGFFNVRRESNW